MSLNLRLSLGGWSAALLAASALAASAQPSGGPGVAGLPPPAAAAAPPGAIAPPAAPLPAPVRKPRYSRPLPGEAAIRTANAGARSYPKPDAYINSTAFFDFEAGKLYEIQTSPNFLTTITLRRGEKLLTKAAGDTVRWVLGETVEGSGPNQQAIVLLRPMRGGLRTNFVLTTDQRTYLIEASSREGGAYTSSVSWNYPQEQMQELAAAQAAKAAQDAAVVASPALAIDQLHFGYDVRPVKGKPPRWQPLRVFDDGTRTYIQFPVNMAATDAPPLFLIGPKDSAQLVNYRYINGYYVVDRLMDVAELRIGEKPQAIVRITRTQGG